MFGKFLIKNRSIHYRSRIRKDVSSIARRYSGYNDDTYLSDISKYTKSAVIRDCRCILINLNILSDKREDNKLHPYSLFYAAKEYYSTYNTVFETLRECTFGTYVVDDDPEFGVSNSDYDY